jgi:DNA-binding NtrC family response regulator
MSVEAIRFSRRAAPVPMSIVSPAGLQSLIADDQKPAVIVLCHADLHLFRQCRGLFRDRGVKDSRKPLSKVLLGYPGQIPFLEAKLSSAGRLKQAVETLLANAFKRQEDGIYVLGVSDKVFQKVRQEELFQGRRVKSGTVEPTLERLLPDQTEPEALRRWFWGESEKFRLVRQLAARAALTDAPLLILGETGTGKSMLARAIHEAGRPGSPFEMLNCAAIPGTLFETELFGYAPGAFTGGLRQGKAGPWELAGNGTFFLDEIGDLPLEHQAAILHALEYKRFRRVGGKQEVSAPARVITATNRNLLALVRSGRFREDLYFRLRNLAIMMPDLFGDPEDLVLIARNLWREIAGQEARLPPEILDELCRHRWPGNVRELRSVLNTLDNLFGAQNLRREQLQAVFQYFGLLAGYGRREAGAVEPAVVQIECIRQIQRADNVLHACEQALHPLAKGLFLPDAARSALDRNRREMQALLQNRLQFGSQETYQAFNRVSEDLGQLLALRPEDTNRLCRFWRGTLAPHIHQAVAQLFSEHQRWANPQLIGAAKGSGAAPGAEQRSVSASTNR